MVTLGKALFAVFGYVALSAAFIIAVQHRLDPTWFDEQAQWTYVTWRFLGLSIAMDYAAQALVPLWLRFTTLLAAGALLLPFLAAPLFGRGLWPAVLGLAGLLAWAALGANLFGLLGPPVEIDRVMAMAEAFVPGRM